MIDGTPENDHFWKLMRDLGTEFFFYLFIYFSKIHILRQTRKPQTTPTTKGFVLRDCKCDLSSVSTNRIIMVQWCGMMDWLSSVWDTYCHFAIERRDVEHRAAAEDCVNIHYTLSDREVYFCWWKQLLDMMFAMFEPLYLLLSMKITNLYAVALVFDSSLQKYWR